MLRFVVRRLLLSIPVLFGIILVVFALARMIPGDSCREGRPVAEILIERLPVTLELALFAMLFAVLVGLPLGLLSAMRRNSPIDVGTMVVANVGVSTPVFVLGLLLAFLFAVVLRSTPFSLPPSGRLSAGIGYMPLAEVWALQDLSGAPRAVLDFFSNMVIVGSLISAQWGALGDALRH